MMLTLWKGSGILEFSVVFAQFICESKLVLKSKFMNLQMQTNPSG